MNPYQLAVWKMVRPPYRLILAPQVSGLENVDTALSYAEQSQRGLLLIANHICAWDPLFICSVLDLHIVQRFGDLSFLGKKELFDRPWKRWVVSRLGCVNIRERAVVRRVIQGLREGRVYFLFPEGCVSCDGRMGRDLGALRFFARHSSFVVLPIRVQGIWGGFRKDWKNIATFRRRYRVAFGRPVLVEKGDHLHLDAMALIRDVTFSSQGAVSRVPSWVAS